MNLSLKDIIVRVPGRILFEGNLFLGNNITYCVVGINGCGKTTLLKFLNDTLQNDISRWYVEQEMNIDLNKTVYSIVAESNLRRIWLIKRIDELTRDPIVFDIPQTNSQSTQSTQLTQPTQSTENVIEHYDEYMKLFNEFNSMDYSVDESIIRRILYGMGFSRDLQDVKVGTLSGGWRMRVNIARGLYMKPALLMLDEPTSHLDISTIIWLEKELASLKSCLLIVSHDRNFINKLADYIIEISDRKIMYHRGDYTNYEKQISSRYILEQKKWEKNQSARIKARCQGKPMPAELPRPSRPYRPKIKAPVIEIAKRNLATLTNCSIGYADSIIVTDINLEIIPRCRIALVGGNGVGKTTLLKVLSRELGPTITGDFQPCNDIGYYSQHISERLNPLWSPVRYILSVSGTQTERAREALGVIGLTSGQHLQPMGELSGGQKARVLLASILIRSPKLLLLDEPTNHLDIQTIDALVTFLNEYNGAVMISTHSIDIITRGDFTIYEICENEKPHTLVKTTLEDYIDRVCALG